MIQQELERFETDDLLAEVARREAKAKAKAEHRRLTNRAFEHAKLSGAVASAQFDLKNAAELHDRYVSAHAGLVALGTAVSAGDVHLAAIRISQANHSRTEAKDRLLQAERALDNHNRGAA